MTSVGALPLFKTLSVMPTQRCTAECLHCGTLSSPRARTALSREHVLAAIDQAAALADYRVVVFTGGEATLAWPTLVAGIRRAHDHGLVTRLVTNGHWARSSAAARRRTGELRSAGLDEINFSTGDQHQRFVALERVIAGIRAAYEEGITTIALMIESVAERTITRHSVIEHPDYQAFVAEYPEARLLITESPWMPLDERQISRYGEAAVANDANLASRSGCDSVLSTTTLQPDGSITACCGLGVRTIPELTVGHLDDITIGEADRRAGDDFLKRWLRVEGPEHILHWAARHDQSIDWQNQYAHRCQACLRVYRDPSVRAVIREFHQEKHADVLVGEYALHHLTESTPHPEER